MLNLIMHIIFMRRGHTHWGNDKNGRLMIMVG